MDVRPAFLRDVGLTVMAVVVARPSDDFSCTWLGWRLAVVLRDAEDLGRCLR